MGVVFHRDLRELPLGEAVALRVLPGDIAEEFGEEVLAVLRLFGLVIARRAEHVRAIRRRHRLLLLGPDDQHHVVQPRHDLLCRRSSTATPPEAQAASVWSVGMPRRDSSMSVRKEPRWSCRV